MDTINHGEPESGYIGSIESDCYVGSTFRDVEVLRTTKINIIARGRRYGRMWLLKGLREEYRDSTAMQRQLQKEFEIHSRLLHKSIVHIAGMEKVDGLGLCIVQEWVEGITLAEAMQTGQINSAERRRIIHELTEAVAYIHSQGIVHRDLKPANVMIRDIGREIALIDFGLADTSDYVEIKAPAGTVGFISPEQEDTGGANPADDVYSLGIIMAELTPGYTAIA
ncbi:MAG: serine/threonine protein kinase, partial [Muribaculum sp.]|nr:serine/threonine protein kinase [Muribaculum sp.]